MELIEFVQILPSSILPIKNSIDHKQTSNNDSKVSQLFFLCVSCRLTRASWIHQWWQGMPWVGFSSRNIYFCIWVSCVFRTNDLVSILCDGWNQLLLTSKLTIIKIKIQLGQISLFFILCDMSYWQPEITKNTINIIFLSTKILLYLLLSQQFQQVSSRVRKKM